MFRPRDVTKSANQICENRAIDHLGANAVRPGRGSHEPLSSQCQAFDRLTLNRYFLRLVPNPPTGYPARGARQDRAT